MRRKLATVVARATNRPALNAHLVEIIRQHPNAYWVERLTKAGVLQVASWDLPSHNWSN